MGLDGVELVMGFEEAFGLPIADEAASRMLTPRLTIDYFQARLATTEATHCLTQRVFYRLRRGLRAALGNDLAVHPATRVRAIADKRGWPDLWNKVRDTAGDPNWPVYVPWKGWLVEGPETLRELTLYITMHLPPPDSEAGAPWTRERIELTVRRVLWDVMLV